MPRLVVTFFVAVLLISTIADAQVPTYEKCLRFQWDYTGDASQLVSFQVYVYLDGEAPIKGKPQAMIPSFQTIVLEIGCEKVVVPTFGTYHACLTATLIDGKKSDFSNEITFTYGAAQTTTPPPTSWEPLQPGQVELPAPPPPITAPSVLPIVWGTSPGGWITDTCEWSGSCAR